MRQMKTLLLVTLFGLTMMTTFGAAEAAPLGTCGAGGGIWEHYDAVCANDEDPDGAFICVVWMRDPSFPFQLC